MKKVFLIGLVICYSLLAGAQENNDKKVKVYKTWIKLNNGPKTVKGVLYEIGDSSLFVSESVYATSLHEYRFSNIDLMKVRRVKSIGRGAIAGSLIGLSGGIITGATTSGVEGIVKGLISAQLGISFAVAGAGFGAFAGTIKDRFPMKNSFENFEKYRGSLQDYSFKQEPIAARNKFEHRGTIGASMGLSIAMNEFATNVPIDNYQGMEMTGFSSKTSIGYRFTRLIGLNFTIRTNQYTVNDNSETSTFWNWDAFTIGPVISLPIIEKLRFDFIPSIGFASAYLLVDNQEIYTGEGLGINMTGALAYDISKRWIASASAGYLSSKQKYNEGGTGNARDFDLELGLAYQFGKRSL